ncbi:hypothetical protein [Nocardia higoensis]|uniref:hypothetical protein n=1 Tax=Nocardia higoensis TaxID=228599 RepID=UPI0002D738A0|nr:hypothetical protein [Nocardia higoensis]
MTAQRTNQAFRYTAIVSASAASLTLTIAAGAYVMSQMAPGISTNGPATILDRPDHSLVEAEPRIARAFAAAPVFPVPASFTSGGARSPVPSASDEAATDPTPTDPPVTEPPAGTGRVPRSEPGGYLDLGVAALDTRREDQRTTVTLTVDPSVTAAVHQLVTELPTEPGVSTTLRTEIDRAHGVVAVGFSDPVLGERSVRMPGPMPSERATGAVSG